MKPCGIWIRIFKLEGKLLLSIDANFDELGFGFAEAKHCCSKRFVVGLILFTFASQILICNLNRFFQVNRFVFFNLLVKIQ